MAEQGVLHLVAFDEDDLTVISATLQDAVVKSTDMVWDKQQGLFAMMLNRFCWEKQADKKPPERVRTGIHFNTVQSVKAKNIPQDKEQPLSLLAVLVERHKKNSSTTHIRLMFSAGAELLLSVESLNVVMQDVMAPWITKKTPSHEG